MTIKTIACNVNGDLTRIVNNVSIPIAYNDIYIDNENNLAISFDLEAILEECAQAARTLLGELIYNQNVGIPYQQSIWIGVPNIQQFNASLRSAFLSIQGVTEVLSLVILQSDVSDINTLAYNTVINTIYGTGAFNG